MAVEVPTGVPCPPLMNAILGTCEMTHFTTEAKLSEAEQSSLLLLPVTSYSSPPLSLSRLLHFYLPWHVSWWIRDDSTESRFLFFFFHSLMTTYVVKACCGFKIACDLVPPLNRTSVW